MTVVGLDARCPSVFFSPWSAGDATLPPAGCPRLCVDVPVAPCPGAGLLTRGCLLHAPLRICTLKRACRCLASVSRGRSILHMGTSLTGLLCAPRSPCSRKRGAHGRYWGPGSLCASSQLPGAGALAALRLVGPISWPFQVRGCPPSPRNSTSQNVCRGWSPLEGSMGTAQVKAWTCSDTLAATLSRGGVGRGFSWSDVWEGAVGT